MLLNKCTFEEVRNAIEQLPKSSGTPILHVENNGIPCYIWSVDRTNKVMNTCFDED